MKGIKNRICRKKVIRMDGFGFPIDWKKVVASITNPRIGVMQKLILNPEAQYSAFLPMLQKPAELLWEKIKPQTRSCR